MTTNANLSVLETERLRLRKLMLEDAALMLAVWNDPAFVRHVGDRGIRTLEEARVAMTEGALKLYADFGYGPYRVALKTDDRALGICGLFRRDGLDDPDIGYGILPEFCGNGYAFEAATAIVEYARKEIGLQRLTAIVASGNSASIGLTEKLGLRYERMIRIPGEDADVCLYSLQLTGTTTP